MRGWLSLDTPRDRSFVGEWFYPDLRYMLPNENAEYEVTVRIGTYVSNTVRVAVRTTNMSR